MDPQTTNIDPHTTAWSVQVWGSWLIAMAMLFGGTVLLPVDLWCKGYLLMGQLFVVGSSFTLSKTVRDSHESNRLRNRITKAKTDKLLKEFELGES